MRTVSFSEFQSNPDILTEITSIINDDGIVCIPTPSGYKLLANFASQKAVLSMMQSKHRVRSAPALVLIPDGSHVDNIADSISEDAAKLMKQFWPGAVTLLFAPSEEIPSKIRKALTKAKGWLGIRVPDAETASAVVKACDKPLLVSSANLAKKGGAGSLAQVKKNFGRTISLLVENGDVSMNDSSTLVDVTTDVPQIVRPGIVADQTILDALA